DAGDAAGAQAEIGAPAVAGATPDDLAAEFLGVFHQGQFPLNTATLRVEGTHDAAFLARHQRGPAVDVEQEGGGTVILVGAAVLGGIGAHAGDCPIVVRRALVDP